MLIIPLDRNIRLPARLHIGLSSEVGRQHLQEFEFQTYHGCYMCQTMAGTKGTVIPWAERTEGRTPQWMTQVMLHRTSH